MRILVILIFGITLSACSGLMIGGGSSGSGVTVAKNEPAGARSGNAVVSERVMARFAVDPTLSKLGLDVSASGGMVTLSGAVPTYAARESAEKLAMATDGVKAVDNQITVEYKK